MKTNSMSLTLKGTRTEQNLLKSFAGESQARNRYEFFASVARKEGFEQIAKYFPGDGIAGERACQKVFPIP